MWYVYKIDEQIQVSRIKPETEYFTVQKMPPTPNNKYMILKADFELQTVWYEEREKTETEIKQERMNEILLELEQFDKTVDRQWEDYYIDNNKTPVERIAVAIKQKEELRAEYQTLEKELKEGEVVE